MEFAEFMKSKWIKLQIQSTLRHNKGTGLAAPNQFPIYKTQPYHLASYQRLGSHVELLGDSDVAAA